MMPEEWPIRTPLERETRLPVLAAGSDRLSTVRRDFFLDPAHRLTEQERALMTAMLSRLVEDVASEIQVLLPQEWLPANEDPEEMIQRLWSAGLLDEEGLVSLLLRRADQERISTAFQARHPAHRASVVQPMVSSRNADVAAAAMAVLVARGRRRDRYGQPTVELDDLPAPSASRLVHAVAAVLCERKPAAVPASEAETRLCEVAAVILSRHDSAKALDRLLAILLERVERAGLVDEQLMKSAIDAGEVDVLGHALAVRSSLDPITVLAELLSGDCKRAMLILRVAGAPRELASHLLAALGDLLGIPADVHALMLFDSFPSDRIEAKRSWLGVDPNFQQALRALGHGHGNGND